MNWPASVAKAVGKVRDNIGAVAKKRDPAGGVKYAFQGWDDIVPELREACKDCGLIIGVNIVATDMNYKPTNSGGQSACWRVKLAIDLVSAEDGACHTVTWEGEANDSGDKGLQKAATSAYKYWALKTFQIPTVEDKSDSDSYQPEPLKATAKTTKNEASKAAQAPVEAPAKVDPLKTAKRYVVDAAKAAGVKGSEAWSFIMSDILEDEQKQVMRWGDFVSSELSNEKAAARIVSLYEQSQKAKPQPHEGDDDPFYDE